MAQVKQLLGTDGDKVQGVFVTVDPERDTPRGAQGLHGQLRPELRRAARHARADSPRSPRTSRSTTRRSRARRPAATPWTTRRPATSTTRRAGCACTRATAAAPQALADDLKLLLKPERVMVQHLLNAAGAARIALIPPEVLEALERRPARDRQPQRVPGARPAAAGAQRGRGRSAWIPQAERLQRHPGHAGRLQADAAPRPRGAGALRSDRRASRTRCASPTRSPRIPATWRAPGPRSGSPLSGLSLPDKLEAVRRFAADPHFGVREMAWMAVRDRGGADPRRAPWRCCTTGCSMPTPTSAASPAEAHAAARRLVRAGCRC